MAQGRWRLDATVVLAALVLFASLGPTLRTLREAPAVDFYHFWLVGPAVRAGEILDIYAPEARRDAGERGYQRAHGPGGSEARRRAATKFRRLETTATPFLYASFAPFVTADYDRDRVAFGAASVLAFFFALAALASRLGYGPVGVLLLLSFMAVAFEPFASDVRVGNVNRLQFGLLTLYGLLLWGVDAEDRFRAGLAGLLIGIAIAWKPNLAFAAVAVGVFWGSRGRTSAFVAHLIGIAVGGLAAVAAASAFFGTPMVWVWWADAALDLPRDFPIPIEDGNFAPLRVLKQGFGVELGVAWTAACVVLLALLLHRAAEGRDRGEPLGAQIPVLLGLGCATSLLASPLSWLHYYLLSAFLVAWVFRPAATDRPVPLLYRLVAVVGVVGVSMGPLLQLLLTSAPYRWAGLGNGGLVLLMLLASLDLLRARPSIGAARAPDPAPGPASDPTPVGTAGPAA